MHRDVCELEQPTRRPRLFIFVEQLPDERLRHFFHTFFSDLLSVWSRLTLIRRKFFLKEIRKRRYLFYDQDLVKDSKFAVGRKKIMTVSDSA